MVSGRRGIHVTATLFTGGVIWPGDGSAPSDALLVRDGRVCSLGDAARQQAHSIQRRSAGAVETVDLNGGFLMPSFRDGHAHPLLGGLEAEGPAVRACESVEQIVAEVRRWAEAHPNEEWVVGASYDGSLASEGLFDARWLDDAVSDRPVVLRAWDYHTVWCNSLALERVGITASTPDPELGEIPRRGDGSPLGTLREWGAVDLLLDAVPVRSLDTRLRALGRVSEFYRSYGVTWVQDAWVESEDVDVYVEAVVRGMLTVRYNLALYADPRYFTTQFPEMLASRRRVAALASPLLTANTVKFFADGVIENETGALLEPYCSAVHKRGISFWSPSGLRDAMRAVDEAGFQTHIHAIGDAAIRQALDAIDYVATLNGSRDRRPVLAHTQLIDEVDLPRFARLNVIANMQPLWAQLDPLMTVLTVPRLGVERADRQYQMASLLASGAPLAFGSDWPVSSADPREGIAVATSRTTSDGIPEGGWVPHEIINIDAALRAYTVSVAHQAFGDVAAVPWGSLRPGMSADMVWLGRDPRNSTPREFPGIPVVATYLAGVDT